MIWNKLGLVPVPTGMGTWAAHTALTPTPIVLDSERIRVFAGFRDHDGVSRIGWVDVSAADPTRVVGVCRQPALDVGRPGRFDDNGVILGDVAAVEDRLRMYYVGFQMARGIKFLAFTGMAESSDHGETFHRVSEAPVLDRSDEGLAIRAIHTILPCADGWRIWYSVGSTWAMIGGKPFPCYHVMTQFSADGRTFSDQGSVCVVGRGDEYRLGRPRVWHDAEGYHMLFTYGTLGGAYLPGYAHSADGVVWTRDDDQVGIALSENGWDSRMLCYLAPVRVGDRWLAAYNGNDVGRDGFGWAERIPTGFRSGGATASA